MTSRGSEPIKGAAEAGYPNGSGPLLFDQLATELSEDAVEISSGLAKRLYNALERGFSNDNTLSRKLDPLHMLEPLKVFNDSAQPNDLIASRVQLNENTGRCPRSGAELRLLNLNQDEKKQLQDSLLYLASSTQNEVYNNTTNQSAKESLLDFQRKLR